MESKEADRKMSRMSITFSWLNLVREVRIKMESSIHHGHPSDLCMKLVVIVAMKVVSSVDQMIIIQKTCFTISNLVRILISLSVLWQYVWCSKGLIFLMATFFKTKSMK